MPAVQGVDVGPGHPDQDWGDPVDARREAEDFDRRTLRKVHQDLFAQSEAEKRCGRAPIPYRGGERNPEVRKDDDGGCWTWGVQSCANGWRCPFCAPRVSRQKGEELQEAIEAHAQRGGEVYFLTVTLPHHAGHRCEDVREAVMESWSYLFGGNPWGRWADRIEYLGAVRALETTHGRNGWHWHVHAVLFTDQELHEDELADCYRFDPSHEGGSGPGGHWRKSLLCWMRDRWGRRVRTWHFDEDGDLDRWNLNRGDRLPDGLEAAFGEPSRHHGVRLQEGDEGAGWYTAKMGLGRETTGMDQKRGRSGHRTPFEILQDVCRDWENRDIRLWREYVAATEGKAHVYWSPAVRERYRDGEEEQTELDMEEEREESDLVLEIESDLWRQAVKLDDDAPVKIEREAERGGPSAVVEYLSRLIDAGPGTDGLEARYSEERRYAWLAAEWRDHWRVDPARESTEAGTDPEPMLDGFPV